MKIVACPSCHTQYDVTSYVGDSLECPCGTSVPKEILTARAAEIHRCGSCGAAVTSQETHCFYCSSQIERESTRFTLICPECYARNPELSAFCTDCGVHFEPQQPPTEETLLQCPVCADNIMEARVVAGLTLQECTDCRGLWIPEDRLDRLVDQAVKAASRREGPPVGKPGSAVRFGPVTYRKCPVCLDSMQRKNFARKSGVIVDWCGHHGSWLDADELEAIAAFVIEEGVVRRVPDEWRMNTTEKRFKAIASQYEPRFSSPQTPASRGSGFVDWISDLLSND